MDVLAIIAIIASIGTLITVFGKTIKKSTCCFCLNCESRDTVPSTLPSTVPSTELRLQSTQPKEFVECAI